MSGAVKRLSALAAQFLPSTSAPLTADSALGEYKHGVNRHELSPTFFLPRAADIEPDVRCIGRSIAAQLTQMLGTCDLPCDSKQEDLEEII